MKQRPNRIASTLVQARFGRLRSKFATGQMTVSDYYKASATLMKAVPWCMHQACRRKSLSYPCRVVLPRSPVVERRLQTR